MLFKSIFHIKNHIRLQTGRLFKVKGNKPQNIPIWHIKEVTKKHYKRRKKQYVSINNGGTGC